MMKSKKGRRILRLRRDVPRPHCLYSFSSATNAIKLADCACRGMANRGERGRYRGVIMTTISSHPAAVHPIGMALLTHPEHA